MESKTIEVLPARDAKTVTITKDEAERVLAALGAKGFSVCLNLDKELSELTKQKPYGVKTMKLNRPYTLKLTGIEALVVCDAINQGIDSHLEAVDFKDLGMNGQERHIEIQDTESMQTLLRRLRKKRDGKGLAAKVAADIQAIESLDAFTESYIQAALWSSLDESDPSGGDPLDQNYSVGDIDSKTLEVMVEDCTRFQTENAEFITEENVATASEHSCEALAGHDFLLTRQGEGVGFWDGDWEEPAATKLTDAAKAFGEFNLDVGDDGKIY